MRINMYRLGFACQVAFVVLIQAWFVDLAFAEKCSGTRPNIIVVITDDQGMGDLSCTGNEVLHTPNIDRFYDNATRFTDFQVSPTCAPTRAAIMSGRPPFKVGVSHTILQRERMALDVFTLPQALKTAGYKTGLFGKWHLGDEQQYLPQSRGFDEVLMHGAGGIGQVSLGDFPPNKENTYFDNVLLHNDTIVQTKGFCTDLFFHAGLAWIQKQHEADASYFAYISLNAPHGPFIAPESNAQRFRDLGYDEKTAGRYGMIENIDENFGLLMDKLKEWEALDNTLIIFMTDNGASGLGARLNGKRVRLFNANMRGNKNSPWEGGTHVPFFCQWKDKLGKGVDIDALSAHIDLYPTLCDLAGVPLPEKMQPLDGRSLVPLMEDSKTVMPDRELFVHCGRWPTGERTGFKYTKCAVRTTEWRLVNNEQLFNIKEDPSEKYDLAKSHPEIVGKLSIAYDQWWDSTEPLLINENLPKVRPNQQPFALRYTEQLNQGGIPDWMPAQLR